MKASSQDVMRPRRHRDGVNAMWKKVGRFALWTLGGLALFLAAVIVYNASWFEAPHGDGRTAKPLGPQPR